jgi:hypothetical protein
MAVFTFLFELYLDVRQHRTFSIEQMPKDLKALGHVTEEVFQKAQRYGKDKSSFGFVHDAWNIGETLLILSTSTPCAVCNTEFDIRRACYYLGAVCRVERAARLR